MLELEPSTNTVPERPDPRPRMPEPPPVRLVSVDDVRLLAPSGLEKDLDVFYVMLLGFQRGDVAITRPRPHIWMAKGDRSKENKLPRAEAPGPIYRAENFRLRFTTVEPPIMREGVRLQGIVLRSLAEAEARLTEAEIQYTRERGLVPGQESLVLQDPAGNWVELTESRATG